MNRITLAQLFSQGLSPCAPFELYVQPIGNLQVEMLLRILPGKRVVMKAKRNGIALLVKIFREKHSYQKEIKGYELLSNSTTATPQRLQCGEFGGGGYCIYEYIESLRLFKDVVDSDKEEKKPEHLQHLLKQLKALYGAGVCQQDLHFGNFAYTADDRLLVLDPASCETINGQREIKENLALLLAQLPLKEWPEAIRGITQEFPEMKADELEADGHRRRKKRLQAFLKKIYRECTYIKRWSTSLGALQRLDIYCVQKYCSSHMKNVLESITTLPPAVEYLKQGESSLVYMLEVDGYKRVVKHSRNKSLGRFLRRCWRRSRASNAWHFSHLLRESGVQTPKPLALIERKIGPLVLESWFVSEYVEADTLLDIWYYEEPSDFLLAQVKNMFNVMALINVSHGDMKATNLLVVDGELFVIDYDGMRQYRCEWAGKKQRLEDRRRFLQNWPKRDIAGLIA